MHEIEMPAALPPIPTQGVRPSAASAARRRAAGRVALLGAVLCALSACGGDGASPFESDKTEIQPVPCAASAVQCR
jgi:hypothetical protein